MFTQDDVDSDSHTEPQRMSIGAVRQLLGKMDSIMTSLLSYIFDYILSYIIYFQRIFTQHDMVSDSHNKLQRMSIGAVRQLLGKMDSIVITYNI